MKDYRHFCSDCDLTYTNKNKSMSCPRCQEPMRTTTVEQISRDDSGEFPGRRDPRYNPPRQRRDQRPI